MENKVVFGICAKPDIRMNFTVVCHTHSNGSLVTFPEFSMSKGGVELLCDGDRLVQHSGQLSSQTESYGTTLPLTNHIVIDC